MRYGMGFGIQDMKQDLKIWNMRLGFEIRMGLWDWEWVGMGFQGKASINQSI